MTAKKQAVAVVRSMGEQQPMQTIRDFVKTVWKSDENLENPQFWNKPSSVSHSFEQRGLSTDTPLVKSSLPLYASHCWQIGAKPGVSSHLQQLRKALSIY